MNIARRYAALSTLLLAASALCVLTSSGQAAAQIRGVVLDQLGSVIPAASVSLFSVEKVRDAKTDYLGQFAFVDLPPGIYELQAKHPGFKTASLGSIRVTDAQAPQVSITMQLASQDCDPKPTASYQERSGNVNLVGSVGDFWAGSVKNATLMLTQLESGRRQAVSSKDNGEFEFTNLAPGKYTLSVAHEDYFERSGIDFWITRENLTRLSPIYIFRKDEHRIFICQ